jgi:UDPglucose--hexose-1-phosphate uridylyltransferase
MERGGQTRVVRTSRRLADGRAIHFYDADPGSLRRELGPPGPPGPAAVPPASRLRWDAWLDEWVVVATHRQQRTERAGCCPLCPTSGEIPTASYQVVVFDNRYPSLPAAAREPGPAGGHSEVVCYTDDHDVPLSGLPLSRVETVVAAWADRTAALNQRPDVAQVFCFENRGAAVGATLAHPHGQIYAYPFVPSRLHRLAAVADARWDAHRECVACAAVGREQVGPTRVVATGEAWTAFVPYAARWPYEVRVVAHRHAPDLAALDERERADLSRVLRTVLRQFDGLFLQPADYMLSWIQAPARPARPAAHVYAEIVSPMRSPTDRKHPAAGELGAGAFVNEVSPERAAAALRGEGR